MQVRLANVLGQEVAQTVGIAPWRFVGTQKCLHDGKEMIQRGMVEYANPGINIKCAVKVGDYVFCLEQNTSKQRIAPERHNDWMFAVFHGNTHASFGWINGAPTIETLIDAVLSTFHTKFDHLVMDKRKEWTVEGL